MCCEPVIDTLAFVSLLVFIGMATYFFNELIAMSALAKKRKKRAVKGQAFFLSEGKQHFEW